jgi:hypothetical protein
VVTYHEPSTRPSLRLRTSDISAAAVVQVPRLDGDRIGIALEGTRLDVRQFTPRHNPLLELNHERRNIRVDAARVVHLVVWTARQHQRRSTNWVTSTASEQPQSPAIVYSGAPATAAAPVERLGAVSGSATRTGPRPVPRLAPRRTSFGMLKSSQRQLCVDKRPSLCIVVSHPLLVWNLFYSIPNMIGVGYIYIN